MTKTLLISNTPLSGYKSEFILISIGGEHLQR
jgi:hypothetical protein